MGLIVTSGARLGGYSFPAPMPNTGLDYRTLGNGVTGGDIRLKWVGANLPSRTTHTILWKALYAQQTGYYAVSWFDENTGVYQFSQYESGAHPFPCSGEHAASGMAQEGGVSGGTGSGGTAHRWELAGVGTGGFSPDYICTAGAASPPSRGLLMTKGVWTYSARTSEIVSGTILRRKYYPNLLGDPTFVITQDALLADLNSPANPACTFGCSPWTSSNFAGSGSGYTNSETPCCILSHLMIFSAAALSLTDINAELAKMTQGAASSAGIASLWYENKSPTPSDITDKSGAGHTPVWANANRPTLYSA